MSTAQFDNPVADHCLRLTLETDANTLLRVLELFALRGATPQRIEFSADDDAARSGLARLQVRARMGRHDWRVLCARAGTLVGVVALCGDAALDDAG